MKLDFSNPEEAPEEFRAVTFNAPPAKKGMRMPSLTALEIQTQGMLLLLLVLFTAYTWLWSHTNANPDPPKGRSLDGYVPLAVMLCRARQ